jgi:hypothetical protein
MFLPDDAVRVAVLKMIFPQLAQFTDVALLPDYELTDHTGKRRKLSELQGHDPMVLVLGRGGYCPKDRRQAEGLDR